MRLYLAIVIVFASAVPAALAQPLLEYGDVLVSTFTQTGPQSVSSNILVYASDGTFKGELASAPGTFRETLYRNGAVYVALRTGIHRIDSTGQIALFSDIRSPVWMSPALDGSFVVANGSGELYHVAADGSLLLYRDAVIFNDPPALGVELLTDQCTVLYLTGGGLIIWDLCQNTTPRIINRFEWGTDGALRSLRDGSFLAAYRTNIAQLDAAGTPLRHYGIPSHGLALDTDGRSFWAGAGSTLLKVDIETGAILVSVNLAGNPAIDYLGVVGEPRAGLLAAQVDIPALSPAALIILAAALGLGAWLKIR